MAGWGIILRSEWDVTPQINDGALVRVLTDYRLPNADIVALTGETASTRSPRTENFINMLREALSSRP
ncbi:hypothetical protein [Pantoea rwandensis]|uniref:hypothetical protein n=1 Tax=Pantoea rwandensis TaxID=1076550 RepID=UPI001B803430|nr:hypothetical protein [Pantoea rwandensis]